jgi:DUF917 family protein
VATTYLDKQSVRDLIQGATLLGAGGGGSPENGEYLLSLISKEIPMIEVQDLGENDLVAMVAGIGSPKVLLEKGFGPEALHAITRLQEEFAAQNEKITYLMSGEMGGFNTLTPIYVASSLGLPFVDADGNGRAVPGPSLYNLYEIPVNPTVLSNAIGDTVTIRCFDPLDAVMHEKLMRAVTMAFDKSAAFTTWVSRRSQIETFLVPGCVSKAIRIGQALRLARENDRDAALAACEAGDGEMIFRGIVSQFTNFVTKDAFDVITNILHGIEQYVGSVMEIKAVNENLTASIDGTSLYQVPDLICTVDSNGYALSNADIKPGMSVSVLHFPAPEPWIRKKEFVDAWQPFLQKTLESQ